MPHFTNHLERVFPLPDHAMRVISTLEAAGAEAWVVGGWVRDALLGDLAHDIDIASSATWSEAATVLRRAGMAVHETGTAHGTITVVVSGVPIEVTTYRLDGSYADHRHPDSVRFVDSIVDDLSRRDFTINALAYHPLRGLLDPYGGATDLALGIIRAVGNPTIRFREDALRVLRALRFASRFSFSIEPSTQSALVAAAPDLSLVSSERVGTELDGIINSGHMGEILLAQPEVMKSAIPELASLYEFDQHSPYHTYDVAAHTAHVCCGCEAFTAGLASRALRWAALLHDIAKPATFSKDESGRGHFFGHPELGEQMARSIMRRFALPSALIREVCTLVRYHDIPLSAHPSTVRSLLLRLEHACPGRAAQLAFSLLNLKRADAISKVAAAAQYAVELDELTSLLRLELMQHAPLSVRDLAVNGSDVVRVTKTLPGPAIGRTLDLLLSRVVAGELANERTALLAALNMDGCNS